MTSDPLAKSLLLDTTEVDEDIIISIIDDNLVGELPSIFNYRRSPIISPK